MKLNRMITLCAMAAALALSASEVLAQIGNGNNNGGGGGGGFGNGGNGGNGGGFGGGGGGGRRNRGGNGGGNFDPAQIQQMMLDRVRTQLEFTNDTDWDAVSPLVQKVIDAQMAAGAGGRGGFGGRGGRGGRGGGGAFGGQTSPEQDALQKAIDEDAPAAQIKDLLAKYRAARKAAQTKLEAAQTDLKAVLTVKQEAEAALTGLVD